MFPLLEILRQGTQRVAEELTRQFPQLRFIRFDSDTTRTKGRTDAANPLANREADLVGTQMLTSWIYPKLHWWGYGS